MTDDGRILDIKTGKEVKTKQRTAQDAKRWRRLLGLINDGVFNITVMGGLPLEKDRIDEFVNDLDDIIKAEEAEDRRLKMRKRRKK